VKSVYFDDAHKLGLPQFLGQRHNAHAKAHMLAIFMVAAEKGYWKTDDANIKQMGGELARLVAANGLPGSGHTAPDHPMWQWLAPQLDAADAQALAATLAKARGAITASDDPAIQVSLADAAHHGATKRIAPARSATANGVAAQADGEGARQQAYELRDLSAAEQSPAERTAKLLLMLAALAAGIALFALGVLRGTQTPILKGAHP
jgi:cobaltochelatase CobN